MAIITISRGSYSKGEEVAKKVAEKCGYKHISRDVILEASKEFNTPEIKLIQAIHDAPSILSRFGYEKETYIAFVRAEILKHFKEDNVVYSGLAGHFFVEGVSHVLKVRIIADFAERVKAEMERKGISEKKAAAMLKKDDEERRKWSKSLYGIDTWDPALYDMTIHIRKITADDAAEIIYQTVQLDSFKPTPESKKRLEDLALAAEIKAALIDFRPDIEVQASNGEVFLKTRDTLSNEPVIIEEIKKRTAHIIPFQKIHIDVRLKDPVY